MPSDRFFSRLSMGIPDRMLRTIGRLNVPLYPPQPRPPEGVERAELWSRMKGQYGGFDEYDARTARDIAVFVLERR